MNYRSKAALIARLRRAEAKKITKIEIENYDREEMKAVLQQINRLVYQNRNSATKIVVVSK